MASCPRDLRFAPPFFSRASRRQRRRQQQIDLRVVAAGASPTPPLSFSASVCVHRWAMPSGIGRFFKKILAVVRYRKFFPFTGNWDRDLSFFYCACRIPHLEWAPLSTCRIENRENRETRCSPPPPPPERAERERGRACYKSQLPVKKERTYGRIARLSSTAKYAWHFCTSPRYVFQTRPRSC